MANHPGNFPSGPWSFRFHPFQYLGTGSFPGFDPGTAGQNTAYADGHVEWVKYTTMIQACPNSSAGQNNHWFAVDGRGFQLAP